jgi:hypothetical protein
MIRNQFNLETFNWTLSYFNVSSCSGNPNQLSSSFLHELENVDTVAMETTNVMEGVGVLECYGPL